MNAAKPSMSKDARFYVGTRDTRWDVYPQREPGEVIAHDWRGFWAFAPAGFWFKTPTSYNLAREITRDEAEALIRTCVKQDYRLILPVTK